MAQQDPRNGTPSPRVGFAKRVLSQSFSYDWLGNTAQTTDDAGGFYERSLGAIVNAQSDGKPYQLKTAAGGAASRDGSLTTAYDGAGNLVGLSVMRNAGAPCLPSGASCSARYVYEWDEVGRLSRARRWDGSGLGVASDPPPSGAPAAELRYEYDASDDRLRKTAVDPTSGLELHTEYIFDSLELRRSVYDAGGDYQRTVWTEVPYLFAHGVRLGRVHYATTDVPTLTSGQVHVLLELPDHLGSTAIVMDRATGELVERSTYQAYGAPESDYRPERWDGAREDYRFTGKEEDVEVGIQYFGKRYYAAQLGRWVSADPLTVHGLGADANLYAYVHGAVLKATDPLGLADGGNQSYVAPSDVSSQSSPMADAAKKNSADCQCTPSIQGLSLGQLQAEREFDSTPGAKGAAFDNSVTLSGVGAGMRKEAKNAGLTVLQAGAASNTTFGLRNQTAETIETLEKKKESFDSAGENVGDLTPENWPTDSVAYRRSAGWDGQASSRSSRLSPRCARSRRAPASARSLAASA